MDVPLATWEIPTRAEIEMSKDYPANLQRSKTHGQMMHSESKVVRNHRAEVMKTPSGRVGTGLRQWASAARSGSPNLT